MSINIKVIGLTRPAFEPIGSDLRERETVALLIRPPILVFECFCICDNDYVGNWVFVGGCSDVWGEECA